MAGSVLLNRESIPISEFEVDLVGMSGPVCSMTLVSGWTVEMTAAMEAATRRYVEFNPVLTGKLVQDSAGVRIELGVHTDGFVKVVEGPRDFAVADSPTESLDAVSTELEPIFATSNIGTLADQVASGGPLFGVVVVTLPGGYVCFNLQLSHMVGDGYTYYKVMAQIDALMRGESIMPMEWKPPTPPVFQPKQYSATDVQRLTKSWLPAYIAKAKYNPPRGSHFLSINHEEVKKLKAEGAPEGGFLSTNDILTAAIAEVTDATVLSVVANMRGRIAEAPADIDGRLVGGNFERVMSMNRSDAKDPRFLRSEVMNKFYGYEANSVPLVPFLACDFGCVTNWSGLTHFISPPGSEVVLHCPMPSFVGCLAFDCAVIFSADAKGTLMLNHNFLPTPEYKKEVAASTLSRRVFAADSRTTIQKESCASPCITVSAKRSLIGG